MTDRNDDSASLQLSEELAQRLLARVVELDAYGHSTTTVARLREVTRELGIPDATFEHALTELRSPALPTVLTTDRVDEAPRSWWRRFARATNGPSVAERILVNVGIFATFTGALGLAARLSRYVGGDWQLKAGLFVLLNFLAVAVARRYRARPVMYLLGVTAVAQSVEYVMHLIFGIRAVQGGDTHWAVLLSAAVALLGAPLLRRPDDGPDASAPGAEADAEVEMTPSPGTARRRWWTLVRNGPGNLTSVAADAA